MRTRALGRPHQMKETREALAANGKGGLKLSLRGADPDLDYFSLVADALGPSVRLEQERVSFAAIHQATLDS